MNIKELREPYTKETYSPKLTKELLYNLFQFLNMEIIKEKQLFSEYDKACLLCAIEIINKQENLINDLVKENLKMKSFIEGNEYDLTPEFRKEFPNGL
jgi:hypothetical protein